MTKEKGPDVVEASDLSGTPAEVRAAELGGIESAESDSRDAAIAQGEYDAKWRSENPDKVLIREANPAVGGESFEYGKTN